MSELVNTELCADIRITARAEEGVMLALSGAAEVWVNGGTSSLLPFLDGGWRGRTSALPARLAENQYKAI